MKNLTIAELYLLAAQVVLWASGLRVGLHWLRQGLIFGKWLPPDSRVFTLFDRVELTLTYVSISLAAFGKKTALSTAEAPVTQASSPAEGKITDDPDKTPTK